VLSYLADRSPGGAKRVGLRIRATIALLSRFPFSGAATSAQRLRRVAAIPYPYLIFYEVADGAVTIIGVRHAARDPSSMPDQS
jgi:toxin ParE1/3/4